MHSHYFYLTLSRLLAVATGVINVPLLLHFLSGEEYGRLAVYWGIGILLGVAEIGLNTILVRDGSFAIQNNDKKKLHSIFTHVLLIQNTLFIGLLSLIMVNTSHIDHWLSHLHSEINPSTLLICLLTLIMLRSFFLRSQDLLSANKNFLAIAFFNFAHPFTSNIGAVITAALTHSAEYTIIVYFSLQMISAGIVSLYSLYILRWRIDFSTVNLKTFIATLRDAAKVYIPSLANIVSYNIDKLLISNFVGVWAAGYYDVSTRLAQALRTLPAVGMESFLPVASTLKFIPDTLGIEYDNSHRWLVYASIIFLLLPIAVAQPLLYTWAGEMGVFSHLAFNLIMTGTLINVLSIPSIIVLQIFDLNYLTKTALFMLPISIISSFISVQVWGIAGIATSTALSLAIPAILIMCKAHKLLNRQLTSTIFKLFIETWPILITLIALSIISNLGFKYWSSELMLASELYAIPYRLSVGLIIAMICLIIIGLFIALQTTRGFISATAITQAYRKF